MYNADKHFETLYGTVTRKYEFRETTREGMIAWQSNFRPELREILGLDNMESDLDGYTPKAEQLNVLDLDDHIRENWYLWVEPTVPLPFYLIRPKAIEGKLPLILTPHGHNHPHIYAGIAHSEKEEQEMLEGERDIARQAAVEEGYIAIAPTTRAFGETRTDADKNNNNTHSCRHQLVHDILVGRTPIGERVWDMSRLIDWAIENLPIDAERIAITGNSGGGTVSLFAAACETRIAVAVPSCYFCTFEGSIGTIRHCECNYVPGVMRLGEMYDVAGLIAPRPFCAISGKDDPIFPIGHVKLAYEKLKEIYTVAGVGDRCELYIGEGGHRYYKTGAWNFVRRFFAV
ncbi:MAG: acetylxylan esterase [Candidatus Poribacteria bacterium]|nr:acetylxylan esterase [Candidatus Poribacteria bacterium]